MLPRLQFNPDIEIKFQHLLTHMVQKNKATQDLLKILEQLCNLEFFYSRSLDTIANNISKLVLGKDPIKDIVIMLERIIASKEEQSSKLAKEIKDDLIPHIKGAIDCKAQNQLKEKQAQVKGIRAGMQRKLRALMNNQASFRKAVLDVNTLPKNVLMAQKDKVLASYRVKEDMFSQAIDSFNSSLDQYMIKFSEICEQFSKLQTQRKMHFRDSVSKLIIFEIDCIKNLEYNFARYMENLNKMTTKLTIEDKFLGGDRIMESLKQGTVVQLAKISNKNYIDSFAGKKNINEILLVQEMKVTELKTKYPPGQITSQKYHSLARTLQPILKFIHSHFHVNLLMEVVFLSKQLYMRRGNIKVTFLTALLAHEVFSDSEFWQQYEKKLISKMQKEKTMASGDEQSLQRNYAHVLEKDLSMLNSIEINPIITQTIQSICNKYKIQNKESIVNEIVESNDFQVPQLKFCVEEEVY